MGHLGLNATINYICRWCGVLNAKVAVRSMVNVVCKQRNTKSQSNMMASLPASRLSIDEISFAHVGIDFFGPLLIEQYRCTLRDMDVISFA